MKIGEGLSENGVVVGNYYDKYSSRNPIARLLMSGFEDALADLVALAEPRTIHEVGCGEGYWVLRWKAAGFLARGTDFSEKIIQVAKKNAQASGYAEDLFAVRNIYELTEGRDSADLVVCCEVLEHLEQPDDAMDALRSVAKEYLIVSVPREPLWRIMNIARGKYLRDLGNTPGHRQHWSRKEFISMLEAYFQVIEVRTPIPWTMALCAAQ